MQIPGYKIIRRINQGGMSTVYLAIQQSVGREVALKVMSPALNADPVFSERFQREANIVGQLSHPNIVAIYDIGRYRNLNYIAMDYLAGGSAHDKVSEGINLDEALRVIIEMATALEAAHQKGYIHRDMKPENILFRNDGTAVLTDFGVAKTLSGASKMTNSGTVVGTPYYMSPEQARGTAIDGRSDLYSLGVVFYEFLAGKVPYKADEAVAVAIKHLTAPIPQLPTKYAVFQSILNRLMSKNPDDRFQRGNDLIAAINEIRNTLNSQPSKPASNRETTSIEINSLFKALLLTIFGAIGGKFKNVFYFILPRKKSTGSDPKYANTSDTQVLTFSDTQENDRSTLLSTSIQQAINHTAKTFSLTESLRRIITAVILFGLIWCAFSMSVTRLDTSIQKQLPKDLIEVTEATDHALTTVLDAEAMAARLDQAVKVAEPTYRSVVAMVRDKLSSSSKQNIDEDQSQSTLSKDANTVKKSEFSEYRLRVNTIPQTTTIKLLNSDLEYSPSLRLPPGRHQIQVTQYGYDDQTQWLDISDRDLSIHVQLRKSPVIGEQFQSSLSNGLSGPKMVIVNSGSFAMGSLDKPQSSPVKNITLAKPFAVGQFEITFSEYSQFVHTTNRPMPKSSGWGEAKLPIVNITWQDAHDYTQWLAKMTDKSYRLMSEAEWEYIARAGSVGDYWWSDTGINSNDKVKANCRRGCASSYSNMFKAKLAPIGSFKGNSFKVFDTAGNAAEWTADCYSPDHYNRPSNGRALSGNCNARTVRGGSMLNPAAELKSHQRDQRDGSRGHEDVSFRVAMDLY